MYHNDGKCHGCQKMINHYPEWRLKGINAFIYGIYVCGKCPIGSDYCPQCVREIVLHEYQYGLRYE